MKLLNIIIILFIGLFCLPVLANANDLANIEFNNKEVDLANEVVLQLTFKGDTDSIYCGLLIHWGDGQAIKYRIGAEVKPPFTIRHKYSSEGVKTVSVKGEFMARGLKSLPACEGAHTASIKVIDLAKVEREKSLLEAARVAEDYRRKAELDAQSAKEELERQGRELAEQRKALEIERKNAEIARLKMELEKAKQNERGSRSQTTNTNENGWVK